MATHPTSDRLGRARRQVAELRSTVTRTNPVCSSCSSTHNSTKHRRQFKRLNSTLRGCCVRHTHSRRARDGGRRCSLPLRLQDGAPGTGRGCVKPPGEEKKIIMNMQIKQDTARRTQTRHVAPARYAHAHASRVEKKNPARIVRQMPH